MKSAKSKSVRKKAPRPSASKPSETSLVKAFESVTQFKSGNIVVVDGYTDGSMVVASSEDSAPLHLSVIVVAAIMRTMAKKMNDDGITLEDLL